MRDSPFYNLLLQSLHQIIDLIVCKQDLNSFSKSSNVELLSTLNSADSINSPNPHFLSLVFLVAKSSLSPSSPLPLFKILCHLISSSASIANSENFRPHWFLKISASAVPLIPSIIIIGTEVYDNFSTEGTNLSA